MPTGVFTQQVPQANVGGGALDPLSLAILQGALGGGGGQTGGGVESALGGLAGQAGGGDITDALLLSLLTGTLSSGGRPFRTKPGSTETRQVPSELADALARFRVRLLLAAMQEGVTPQTFREFAERGPREGTGLPRLPGAEAELEGIARRPGTTTSRSTIRQRGGSPSAVEQAFSAILPALVLLGQGREGLGGSLTGGLLDRVLGPSGGGAITADSLAGAQARTPGLSNLPQGVTLEGAGSGGGNLLTSLLSLFGR